MEHVSLDKDTILKMVFIYNAVINGWTVKKGKNIGEFELKKNRIIEENEKKEFSKNTGNDSLSDYLVHFIRINSKMEVLLSNGS